MGKAENGKIVPGVRIYSELLKPGQNQPFINWLVAAATLTLYCGFMTILIILFVASFFSRACLYVSIAIWSTLLLPKKPLLWGAFNRLWVFKTWREYFRFSYCFDELIDPTKRMVLYEAPHGSFPIGPVVAGTFMQTHFPDHPVYSIAASSVFNIPLWRHFTTWIGSLPATKHHFKKLCKKHTTAVVVGGIAEMYMQDKERERIKLLGRKGFVRVALEEQVDGIVPVYYFGQSQVLDFGPKVLANISRKIRVSLGVLIGLYGLPTPRPQPIFMVHGKVIPVPKVSKDDPEFEKHVDDLAKLAVQGMQNLYDRYKGMYGWANRPLSIE